MQPKPTLIAQLIAHAATAWTPQDEPFLTTFTDEQLARLVTQADAKTVTPGSAGAAPATPVTMEALTALLAERDAALEQRVTTHMQQGLEATERGQLLTALVAHGFTEPECTAMPLETLRKIASTVAPVSYAGMGFPAFGSPGATDDLPDDGPKWD